MAPSIWRLWHEQAPALYAASTYTTIEISALMAARQHARVASHPNCKVINAEILTYFKSHKTLPLRNAIIETLDYIACEIPLQGNFERTSGKKMLTSAFAPTGAMQLLYT
ncbi:hypothetical protein ACHHYP_04151 [Achlya hypogyna]|uniref:Uncharacterized protein n=1 Tax=Achlya hypogyna TaxID=1202772 RepID=A0A1V9Z1U6_ACHHY|nr:hypothetical protein ACHHYP_04151 [Achlya hypogyna]